MVRPPPRANNSRIPLFIVTSALDSSSAALPMQINSAGTHATSNASRTRGRQDWARPLPAAGFTNTIAGNKEEMALASGTWFVILPNSLCSCQSKRRAVKCAGQEQKILQNYSLHLDANAQHR